jgi:large subunit ribosomal protein L22e
MPPVSIQQPKAASASKTAPKAVHKFYVDYSVPANDNVFDPASFEKFLHDRIKVDGKPGQLGDAITLNKEGELGRSSLSAEGRPVLAPPACVGPGRGVFGAGRAWRWKAVRMAN